MRVRRPFLNAFWLPRFVAPAAVLAVLGVSVAGAARTPVLPIPGKTEVSKASGAPINIGIINQEGSSTALSFGDWSTGASAAVKYVNTYLGGVRGRPLQTTLCKTVQTADSATACANQMVDRKLPLVLVGVELTGAQHSVLSPAGVPTEVLSPVTPADINTSNVYALSAGSAGNYAGTALFFKKKGWTRAAIVYISTGQGGIDAFAKPYFRNAGIKLTAVSTTIGGDVTPGVQLALAADPQAIMLIGDAATCINYLKALTALGKTSIPKVVSGACSGQNIAEAAPEAFADIYSVVPIMPDTAVQNPDVAAYRAAMAKFAAKGIDTNSYAKQGFAAIIDAWRILSSVQGEITSASVNTAFKAAKQVPSFMSGGGSFTCAPGLAPGELVPSLKSMCGTYVPIAQYVKGTWKAIATVNTINAMR